MLLRRYHNVEQVQETAPVADEEKVIDKPEVANNEATEEDKEPEEKKTKAGVKKNGTKTSKK